MGQIALLRSMLVLVEHRLKQNGAEENCEGGLPATNLTEGLESNSPEAILLNHIESLSAPDLTSFRQEICLAALRNIDRYFAAQEVR